MDKAFHSRFLPSGCYGTLTLAFSLLLAIIFFFVHFGSLDKNEHAAFATQITSTKLNMTLRVSGICRSFTYCGVDSRPQLLHHFDVSATPNGEYSKAHVNWARVLLLKETLARCRDRSSWIVYSDTDAYITSRRKLFRRLAFMPPSVHLIFMNGFWVLNSGFSAWRTSNISMIMIQEWMNFFAGEENFYAEQKSLNRVYKNFSEFATHRPNGFLGWHMKGDAQQKLELSDIGRSFPAGLGDRLLIANVSLTVFIFALFVRSRRSKTQRLRGVSNLLRKIAKIATSRFALIILITLAFLILYISMIIPYEELDKVTRSKINLTHGLPQGRVMFNHGDCPKLQEKWCLTCLRMRWWCSVISYPLLARRIFFTAEVFEWSAILWTYVLLFVGRLYFEVSAHIRSRNVFESQVKGGGYFSSVFGNSRIEE